MENATFFYKKYCVVVIPLHSTTHRDVVFVSWSYVRARCGLVSHLGRCCLLTASPLFSLLTVTLLSFCQFLISFAVTFQRFCRFFIFSSAIYFSFACNCKNLLFYFWTNRIDLIFAFLSYIFFETLNKP